MLSLKKARVVEKLRKVHGRTDIVVEVGRERHLAVSYDALTGDVEVGDEVIVNTVAADLGLGSGGSHFVLWNLNNEELEVPGDGHIMKLRYTPLQLSCLSVEEESSPHRSSMKEAVAIEGMPVVVGTLHSQLAPAAATLKYLSPGIKVAYVMTDGAALPLALSDAVAELKEKGALDVTITCGNAFGGDLEAVNIYSALVAAKVAGKADVTIATMGPGIVGTDTPLGFSGMEQGQIVNAVDSLGGAPIAVPRISFADSRARHRGLSHHTATALGVAARARCAIAFPEMASERKAEVLEGIRRAKLDELHDVEFVDARVAKEALDRFGLRPTTMGRSFDEDPEFFLAAGAAAICALKRLKGADAERRESGRRSRAR